MLERLRGSSVWAGPLAAALIAFASGGEAADEPDAASAATPIREVAITHDTLGPLTVYAPHGSGLRAFVVYLDDDPAAGDGAAAALTAARRASVARLVARGAAVVPINARAALDRIAKAADEDASCLYALGEFEGVSTLGQRALNEADYRWPVLLGDGPTAGTLAYLALAQASANTAAGAVSLTLDRTLDSARPLCPGAQWTQAAPGRFTYAPSADLPGPWTLVAPGGDQAASEEAQAFVRADAGNALRLPAGPGSEDRLRAGEEAALAIGSVTRTGLDDLPLIELPARPPEAGGGTAGRSAAQTLAIFVSGDGGWRDIDKTIAEELAARGVPVVGIDALRYFWTRKTPETFAKDLERVASVYGQRWNTQGLALLGYSMGADAMPFAWEHFGPATRSRVRLIGLIGFETTAAFEISIAGFAGIATADDVDVRPALRTLPLDRVLCVYGAEEQADGDTGCTLPELRGATLLERPGSHHFDGNYAPVTQAIIDRLK